MSKKSKPVAESPRDHDVDAYACAISKRFRDAAKTTRYTRKQLAAMCGLRDVSTLYNYLAVGADGVPRRVLPLGVAIALSKILGFSLEV